MHQHTLYAPDVNDIVEFTERDNGTSSLMYELKEHHAYTYWHSIRVAHYSMRLATKYAYSGPEQLVLLRSALLHDIGKLMIPQAILNKTGSLSTDEWSLMHIHPLLGHQMLESASDLVDLDIIRQHHENMDGSGYPRGLIGNQLSLSVRIVRVADSFDAMTSSRGYNKVMNGRHAMAELHKWVGKSFDHEVVNRLQEYYSENVSELDSIGTFAD